VRFWLCLLPQPLHTSYSQTGPWYTRCVFLGYSTDHKGYRRLDLSTNNIVVSRYVVFDEAVFSFSTSPRLTNYLDNFLQDDAFGAAPMPAPLPVPRVPIGIPLLAAGGGQTVLPGSHTAREQRLERSDRTPRQSDHLRTEVGGQTALPGDQTTLGIEDGGQTAAPGGQTARPIITLSSATSSTSATPRMAPLTPPVPHTARRQ
jgi:hypothetical protein